MSKIKIMTQSPKLSEQTADAAKVLVDAIVLILAFTAVAVWCIAFK